MGRHLDKWTKALSCRSILKGSLKNKTTEIQKNKDKHYGGGERRTDRDQGKKKIINMGATGHQEIN